MRTVRRAALWLPGSYFIVLPLTHPESRICGNERGAEPRVDYVLESRRKCVYVRFKGESAEIEGGSGPSRPPVTL